MPSGHAQITTIAAIFWSLYIYASMDKPILKYILIGILWMITFWVWFTRVYIGCHTVLQIFIGFLVGLAFGPGIYKLIKFISYYAMDEKTYDDIFKHKINDMVVKVYYIYLILVGIIIIITLFISLWTYRFNASKFTTGLP